MTYRRPAEVFPPGDFIREEMEARGWNQGDLARIMGRPLPAINLIISGKKSLTPETASGLAGAFGTSPEFWLNLQSAYQLSKLNPDDELQVRKRAKLFECAPVSEMEKRGWIRPVAELDALQNELTDFFSLPETNRMRVAARTSLQSNELTPVQLVWCIRVLHLAKSLRVAKFTNRSLEDGLHRLRGLADFPENIHRVPKVLGEAGIRLVVVEHLPGTKIDGAALWLGEDWDNPVIALSLRYDRIDSFWHTLFHELSHIKHRDADVVDVDLVGADRSLPREARSETENRANEEAASMLIPAETLRSFIQRTRPFYSSDKIIQFANRIKIHPGIIAGQLQFRKEIEWAAHRRMLVKVRKIAVSSTLTDGWGVVIAKPKVVPKK